MAHSFDRLKELNLTRDEVERIGEALKKEEFRKLLADYVDEIQDPENRKIYEEEVKQLERERGEEVTFLHPTAGYVIKTSVDGNQKSFINICSNDNINKPTSSPSVNNGARGLQWSLPHSLSPPQEDVDNKGVRCKVFDVLFHPDTLHLATRNRDFRNMVNTVALEAVENNFNVNLDKKNIKFPKMTYKGMKRASIMRKACKKEIVDHGPEEQQILDKIYSDIDSHRNLSNTRNSPKKVKTRRNSSEDASVYATPQYLIKHRSHVDMQDCTENRDSKFNAAVPKELIVEINLPLLKSSSDMNLDVTEKTVQLLSDKPAKYKLSLTLPYEVNEVNGTAKFDKDLKKLVITLPVKRKIMFDLCRDDSGVESSFENDLNSPTNQESEEEYSEMKNNLISVINSDKPEHLVKKQSTDVRTDSDDDFLNTSDFYNLPDFSCNVFDNIVAFTFNVKNVDESTVSKKCSLEKSLIKIKFTSVSSSFYPTCYSFYVKLSDHKFIEEDVTVETWDNNVILQIPLLASDTQFLSYSYGTSENGLTENFIEEPAIINRILEESLENHCDDLKQQCQDMVQPKESKNNSSILNENALAKQESSDETSKKPRYDEDIQRSESSDDTKPVKSISKAIDIFPTSYESSGDELSASSFSPRKGKGILKRMSNNRSKFGRSISESSLDDFMCSSFENYHGSIECVPEQDEEVMSSSMKKTVRFNDNVTRQLFRSNSSILGQKKKNQRKARNKKRACERRYSESEASDAENKKEGEYQTNNNVEKENESDNNTSTEKKDDADIFHLEMNC